VVQLAALLSDSPVIRAGALHFEGRPAAEWSPAVAERAELSGSIELRGRTLEELEELAIRARVAASPGSRHAVSEELGIARSTLLRKLDLLGLRE
jgi:DNA-binding NtrC family response regulator